MRKPTTSAGFVVFPADRTGLERWRVYALDTISCEGGGFGGTELRPGKELG